MNTAELFVKCLENESVRYAFGLPGEENLELLHSLVNSSIKTIITRDERGAAFMANAYGRLTGKPGVCFATLGPGATNLVTGTADALLDFAPMIAITAQASSMRRHKEAHQYIDVMNMFKPIVKWNATIHLPEILPEVIRKGFKLSSAEKPGPVHIELPEDVALLHASGKPINVMQNHHSVTNLKSINEAIRIIKNSKSPLILAGHGVVRNNASKELISFAESTNIHVICTFMGMGTIPADHRLFISTIGLQSREFVQCGIDKSDLIIAIGYDPVEFSPKWWDNSKKVIHIDSVSSEVDTNYESLDLVGDIKFSLNLLTDGLDIQFDDNYYDKLKADLHTFLNDDVFLTSNKGITPLSLLNVIRDVLDRDDILISDVGAHKIWMGRFYRAYLPNTALISNGFASMGFATPAAIAAKLAFADKKIAVLAGDAGFMMSVAELETAVRYNLAFVILICNDEGYGLIRWKQQNRYKKDFFVDFKNPNFVKLAESFGCKGYKVTHSSELLPILREAFICKTPVVIDCKIDYSVNNLLTQKLGQIICRI